MREQVKNAAHVYCTDEIRSWSRYRIVLRTLTQNDCNLLCWSATETTEDHLGRYAGQYD